MKPEDQITALAKWDGWAWNPSTDIGGKAFPECWTHDDHGFAWSHHELPNYLSDLNAIRPLLLKLNAEQRDLFCEYVVELTETPDSPFVFSGCFGAFDLLPRELFPLLTSPPELLCKALLKTLKLWM
jgi:hypothetical protein